MNLQVRQKSLTVGVQIIEKHGKGSKHGRLYLSMANMIEYRFTDN